MSRLMQACGLKPHRAHRQRLRRDVTPYAGVWIETRSEGEIMSGRKVTPYAGVWIETSYH